MIHKQLNMSPLRGLSHLLIFLLKSYHPVGVIEEMKLKPGTARYRNDSSPVLFL